MKEHIDVSTWLGWIGAGIAATAIIITYAFANFETITHNKEMHENDRETLQRIENKIDALENNPPTWPDAPKKPRGR